MIDLMKEVVKNYMSNAKLTELAEGTVEATGVRISSKTVVPNELITGNLKEFTLPGDRVKLIRNTGGQEYYVVEIIGRQFITKGSRVTLSLDGVSKEYKVEDVVK